MQTAGVLLVAVEQGATLPTWIAHCQDRVSDVFVLVGNNEEPIDALQKRVEQRLHLLSGSEEQRQGLVVLVTEPGCASEETEASRFAVANRFLGYLAQIGEGMLLLLSEETASLESRVQLLSLAGTLAQRVRGTKISISVRFGSQAGREPPQEVAALSDASSRRGSRRAPPKSGLMPKPSMVPPIHKAPSLAPKRRLSDAG